MSSPQPLDKYQEIAAFVNQALGSREKSQLRFASVRALNAFDTTGELIFFSMYAECQLRINRQKGYQIYRDFIAKKNLKPNPNDPQNVEFFTLFAIDLLLNDEYEPGKDLKREALELVTPFIERWERANRKEHLLHILLENHEIEQMEEIAYRWLEEEKYFSTLFLMHACLVQDQMVGAFNYFCDLLALLNPDSVPEIGSFEELSALIEQTHYMFSIYSRHETNIKKPPPHELKYSDVDEPKSDLGVMFNNIAKLSVFICNMLEEARPAVSQEEMDMGELSESWQQHYFGFRNVPAREQGESGLAKGYEISIDPDSGDIASAATH